MKQALLARKPDTKRKEKDSVLRPILNPTREYAVTVKIVTRLFTPYAYWFLGLLLSRVVFYLIGLRYDGNRLIETFMQFPDVRLLNLTNMSDIFFDFHASAPGLPILYIFLHTLSPKFWWLIAYFAVFVLGVFANYYLYQFLLKYNFSSIKSSLITLFILGLNPAIILYEAQFYSTAIVSYSLVIILYLLKFSQLNKRYVFVVILLLSNLIFMRPSYLLYFALPLSIMLIKRLFPINSATKFLSAILCTAILAIPIWAQASRITNYGLPTMAASGATGVLLGLSSFPNFKGFPYAPAGYYPFAESTDLNSNSQEMNPDINSTPRKSNGLPNWNYDVYLKQQQLDTDHFVKTLVDNKDLLAPFVSKSLIWSLTNPACSRVILSENYATLSFLDGFPRNLLLLRSPWQFENSQLAACAGSSSLEFSFLLLLLLYLLFSIKSFLMFFDVFKSRKTSRDFYLLLINVFAIFSILVSILNGSPEVSKYRLESEAFMFMMVIYFLTQIRQQVPRKL
jgi:hypothetical protein